MKYIVIEQGGLEVAVLFPCFWNHTDMFRRFPLAKLISAGIVRRTKEGKLYCTGNSVTLKVSSRPIEDLNLILRQIDFELA